MPKFTPEQREAILRQARENIADRPAIEADIVRRMTEPPPEDCLARFRREDAERKAALAESRARAERRESRERQQEPEGNWDDWERWLATRIQAAIEVERAAIVKNVEQAVGEVIAKVAHDIRRDLHKEFEGLERKLQELETLWRSPKAGDSPVVSLPRRIAN